MFNRVTSLIIFVLLCCCSDHSTAKKLRLPILLRSPKIDCNFTTNECGLNQNMERFEFYHNSTHPIGGRSQFYQFAIDEPHRPIEVARLRTNFFPNLRSDVACLHIEYNVQGANTFLVAVSQKIGPQPPRLVYSDRVFYSPQWKNADIQMNLAEADSQFIIEALCQWCSKGSTFSVSRITFSWDSC